MVKVKLLVPVVILLSGIVIGAKDCLNKTPFQFHELKQQVHSGRVTTTLEAVFNRKGFNYTVLEGHTCRNASGNVFWYHVILDGDDEGRSEVSYLELRNGAKRGRVDYLVREDGQQNYVYRWKVASIK
uniref:Putative conserved secreted protein n=1 Tax=Culex tarsalis TaxID=7177 RepID=A0A1Q3FQ70_CULTA